MEFILPRDPKVNFLVKIGAKNNKLEGTIDVLQDRPELRSDLSGSYVVLDNQDSIYTTLVAYPNGQNPRLTSGSGSGLLYGRFKRGLNPAANIFGSPFIVPPKILQTFEEASGLDGILISGTVDQSAYLTEEGKYADNAIPFKNQDFRKELDIKWSGRKIDGLAPLTTSVGAYSVISPNWQKPLSPQASPQFQTGNLWIQQPIENLWQGDEVIWKLTSGSGFERGDRVGRNLITGIVGPTTSTFEPIPVIDGINTTGSQVAVYGSDTSQERFLEGGAIRDNSSSRTYGSHFRPANNSTLGSGTTQSPLGLIRINEYDVSDIEHSGRLILSTERKTWDYKDIEPILSPQDEQSITINKLRSPEYIATLPPLKIGGNFESVNFITTNDGKLSTRRALHGSAVPQYDDNILERDYEGNLFVIYDYSRNDGFDLSNAVTSSLSAKYKTFIYDFKSGSSNLTFPKISPQSTFLPSNSKLYLGSQIRFYFGDVFLDTADGVRSFLPDTLNKFEELILLTSKGQIFIKRDLGLTDQEFSEMEYIDFADRRLFFASEDEISPLGDANIQIKNIIRSSLIEVVGAVGLFPFESSLSDIYRGIALQYYKVSSNKQFYFNSTGHPAHLMGSDPYSYIVVGNNQNPSRDPGFTQAEGNPPPVWGYSFNENIINAVDKRGVAKFYFGTYNPQFGKPQALSTNPRNVNNTVSRFKSNENISSSNQYIFEKASDINFTSNSGFPFLSQGFLKFHNIRPKNTEATKDLSDIGFSQNGNAPILRFTDSYKTTTDVHGFGYLSDLPDDYIPYYDADGNVSAFFGSDLSVGVTDSSDSNLKEYGNINVELLRLMSATPNFAVEFDSNANLGMIPYNSNNKNGVAYRALLAKPLAQVSSSIYWYARAYAANNISYLPNYPIPRISKYNITPGYEVNYNYWLKDPTAILRIPQQGACALTGSYFIESSGGEKEKLIYPNSLVLSVDRNNNIANGFADFDRGIISSTIDNPTKNKFHQLNSDIIISSGTNQKSKLGLFIHTPQDSFVLDENYPATSTLALNFMYEGVPVNSKILHTFGGFSKIKFNLEEDEMTSANRLFKKGSASSALEIQGSIRNMNQFNSFSLQRQNNFAFACYTISDAEQLYGGKTFSSQSLFGNASFVYSSKGTIPDVPSSAFLNIPISQSNTSVYPGTKGASVAYLNGREYLNSFHSVGLEYQSFYTTNKFYVHPKGINYAIAPTDQYFGTAVLDDNSNIRQITKKLKFYVENSIFQDAVLTGYKEDSVGYAADNFRDNITGIFSPLYGLPAGAYTWILNIQDMIPPIQTDAWFSSSSPPNLFSANTKAGEDNGLRSNFYWNIPQCSVNKSLFNTITSNIITDNEINIIGTFTGIDGPDPAVATPVLFSDLTYDDESTISFRITDADDLPFESKDIIYPLPDQYKGVFIPDPTNSQLGRNGLFVEGGESVELANGEKAQAFKRIRIDLLISNTIPLSSFLELCQLAVSFRPNSNLPEEIIEPQVNPDNLTLKTWSPYKGEDYEDALRFNTGHAFCFARVSSIGFYQSLYSSIFHQGSGGGSAGNLALTSPILPSVPYDPFGHDPESPNPFYDFRTENLFGAANSLITYKTPIGYHSLLSFGDSCGEFDIGSLTGTSDTFRAYHTGTNPSGINRSIIDQGNSINIINLAGIAIKTEEREG